MPKITIDLEVKKAEERALYLYETWVTGTEESTGTEVALDLILPGSHLMIRYGAARYLFPVGALLTKILDAIRALEENDAAA